MTRRKLDARELFKGLEEYELKMRFALETYAENAGQMLENEAKTNFEWTPRTARAHQSLNGGAEWKDKNNILIYLSHGVDYGEHLEFAYERKYAIVKPTIDKNSPKIMKGLENLI